MIVEKKGKKTKNKRKSSLKFARSNFWDSKWRKTNPEHTVPFVEHGGCSIILWECVSLAAQESWLKLMR